MNFDLSEEDVSIILDWFDVCAWEGQGKEGSNALVKRLMVVLPDEEQKACLNILLGDK